MQESSDIYKPSTDEYIRDLMIIFFARKEIIFKTMFYVFLAAVLVALFWPPTYTASGNILVKSRQLNKSPQTIEATETRVWEVNESTMITEMKILTSPKFVLSSLKALNEKGTLSSNGPLSNDALLDLAEKLAKNLQATVFPNSTIIELSLKGKKPEELKTMVDALMYHHIKYRSAVFNPTEAKAFYKDEADAFKKSLDGLDQKILRMSDDINSANPTMEIQNNLEVRKSLEQQLDLVKQDLIKTQYTVELLSTQLENKDIQFFSSIENVSINKLGEKLQEIYRERSNLLRTFTEQSEKIKVMNEQVEDFYSVLRREVSLYVSALKNKESILLGQIRELEVRIQDITERNLKLHRIIVEQGRLVNDSKVMEQSYQIFSTRSEEARIASTSTIDSLFSISVLNWATLPTEPTFPNKKVIIPLGLVLGFVLGLCLGYSVDFFDHTFKSPTDPIRYIGLPTIFTIPERGEIS